MADDDDDDEQPPELKIVSDNPNAPQNKIDRAKQFAKEEAERTLAVAAATMLRAIAGSDSAAAILRKEMIEAILAENEYQKLSGQWLASWDRQKALALPQPEFEDSHDRYRLYERDSGMHDVVQGSLRLAAHQILGERPHFGGKYSERLIEQGMGTIARAIAAPPRLTTKIAKKPQAQRKEETAPLKDSMSTKGSPQRPKKPWSSRDSRSYRDLKPEE